MVMKTKKLLAFIASLTAMGRLAAEQKTAMLVSGFAAMSTATIVEVAGWGVVVLVVALFGWAVSSLEALAGWTDDATKLAKLTIIKGIFASVAAAAIVVAVGNWQEWHPLVIVGCAFLGGMAGDKLLRPLSDGLTTRLGAMLDALLGKGGPKQ